MYVLTLPFVFSGKIDLTWPAMNPKRQKLHNVCICFVFLTQAHYSDCSWRVSMHLKCMFPASSDYYYYPPLHISMYVLTYVYIVRSILVEKPTRILNSLFLSGFWLGRPNWRGFPEWVVVDFHTQLCLSMLCNFSTV